MHKILKGFPYSPDGVRVVPLAEGDEAEIRAELVDGLAADGFIGPTGATVASAFDPATADVPALRAFLSERGVKPHHKTGEDKLREMAAAELAKE
ncbi:hypothetical protein ACJ41P_10580 [Azospirillum argentinense]|uniref:DUF2795 domain-containing protein n=1 Tax=Azospirillum argentinense TaxID=2970906 RepID=A0ABW8V4Z1_9PROT